MSEDYRGHTYEDRCVDPDQPMPAEPSALDVLTDERFCDPDDGVDLNMIRAARAELSALRARDEDRGTLLRLAMLEGPGTFVLMHLSGSVEIHDADTGEIVAVLDRGDDGLPVLTPAARERLKAATGGERG